MRTKVSILLSCLIYSIALQAMLPEVFGLEGSRGYQGDEDKCPSGLSVGYYNCKARCPDAEATVKRVVEGYLCNNRGLGAGLIRLFFHDCFVRGCDASVLLNQSNSNPNPEKFANPNLFLRGFEIIDAAKRELEKTCAGKVSCADIIAFAARDASNYLGDISYNIPSGRYDGKVSDATETSSLPPPSFNLQQLNDSFIAKGLSTVDLVALLGSHSIGQSHCSSFSSRLRPTFDPTMNKTLATSLNTTYCPPNAPSSTVVPQDFVTPNNLDKQYYSNVLTNNVLFFSDWSLRTSIETQNLVQSYNNDNELFKRSFGQSMINLGNIGVLSENQGEIRSTCSATKD